jgi:predicted GTPase
LKANFCSTFKEESSQCQYPDNLGVNFLDNLKNTEEDLENELSLPDVNISSLNVEQKFAFNLVMKTLIKYENNSTDFTPLRLIVAGSAGCGKSYLIKCLVKAVKMLYNSNKSVQILCPTVQTLYLVSLFIVFFF